MTPSRRAARRDDALSRERIVEAAVELLDAHGESELTFRALTTRLATGAGAIYHHVAGRDELLAAATDAVVAPALARVAVDGEPRDAIRAIAAGIFDAIDAHPWVGAQLPRNPQPAVLRIWLAVGRALGALGVTGPAQSDAGAALVNYVLGAAAQFAAGAGARAGESERRAYLDALAAQLTADEPEPDVTAIATELREHDDRAQFLAGVEIFLAGIAARAP